MKVVSPEVTYCFVCCGMHTTTRTAHSCIHTTLNAYTCVRTRLQHLCRSLLPLYQTVSNAVGWLKDDNDRKRRLDDLLGVEHTALREAIETIGCKLGWGSIQGWESERLQKLSQGQVSGVGR